MDHFDANQAEPPTCAVKISKSLKRKADPKQGKEIKKMKVKEKSTNRPPCQNWSTTPAREINHLVLCNIEGDSSTDSDGSETERKPFVIHGKLQKGLCNECNQRLSSNERCNVP